MSVSGLARDARSGMGIARLCAMEREHSLVVWLLGVLAIAGAVAAGLAVAHGHYYKPGDDIGYNMGLVGGLMMLALLIYPIRKNFRFAHRWGGIRYWFSLHMMLGIFGPLLVLFHSTFQIHSINAGVALACMTLVASSGFIGRFAYKRIHHGLYGSQVTLQELQNELFGSETAAESRLKSFPRTLMVLHDFHRYALETEFGLAGKVLRFFSLPLRRQIANYRCMAYLPKGSRHARSLRQLVLDYLYSVERLAQFGVFVRIFALWHVIHIPLVYLLAATAIWHVVAVHMY